MVLKHRQPKGRVCCVPRASLKELASPFLHQIIEEGKGAVIGVGAYSDAKCQATQELTAENVYASDLNHVRFCKHE